MAVIEIKPQPFFGNKNRAFWNLQSAGWAGALVLRGSVGNCQWSAAELPGSGHYFHDYRLFHFAAAVGDLQKSDPQKTAGNMGCDNGSPVDCGGALRLYRRLGVPDPESGDGKRVWSAVPWRILPGFHDAGSLVSALLCDQFLPARGRTE